MIDGQKFFQKITLKFLIHVNALHNLFPESISFLFPFYWDFIFAVLLIFNSLTALIIMLITNILLYGRTVSTIAKFTLNNKNP